MTTSTEEARGWNVHQRSDGQWVLQYKDERPNAKKKWPEKRIPRDVAQTEKQAERYGATWVAEWRKKIGENPVILPEPDAEKPKTIRDLADGWLDLRDADATLRPATKAQSKACMRLHILTDPIADRPLVSLRWQDFEAWVERVAKGKAPFTARNVCNTMSAFLESVRNREWCDLRMNWMRHDEVTKKIPAAETVAEKQGIDKVVFSKVQVEKLLLGKEVPEERRVRYMLAALTGLRDGEFAGLVWRDMHTEAAIPHVDVTKALATRGEDGWASPGKLKTRGSKRKVPLHPQVVRVLNAWRTTGWVQRIGRAVKDDDPVFPGIPKTKEDRKAFKAPPFRPASADLLRRDLDKAKLPKDFAPKHPFTFHAFRRTFATMLTDAEVSSDVRDALLGHLDGSTAERHYVGGDHLRRAYEAGIAKLPMLNLTMGEVIALPMRAVSGVLEGILETSKGNSRRPRSSRSPPRPSPLEP